MLKEKIIERVQDIRSGMNSVRGSAMGNVFFWQEVRALAEAELKQAWGDAQAQSGKIESDDEMRGRGEGDHVITQSRLFSVVAKVTAPRKALDVGLLAGALSKRFKLPSETVLKLIEECKVPGDKPVLQKRVLEI